jgi:pimeloyl-ACP methyl ester carboxylesterase
MRILPAVIALWLALGSPLQAQDLQNWGVVILHGKSGPGRATQPIETALRAAGARVVSPTMSWAKSYRTYEKTLDEVSGHVAALRSQGARRIAILGQSLGANVALGYGARRDGIDAVVAVSPGHQPDRFLRFSQSDLARAKQMVAQGLGDEPGSFVDVNQGRRFQVKTTAAAYVSFFDPAGPAMMRSNAANLKTVKLLWVVGSNDKAAHDVITGGTVVNVEGDHRRAGATAAGEVVRWLKRLAAERPN